jgi:hypothetical protein
LRADAAASSLDAVLRVHQRRPDESVNERSTRWSTASGEGRGARQRHLHRLAGEGRRHHAEAESHRSTGVARDVHRRGVQTYAWFLSASEHEARLFRLALRELPALTLLPLDLAHHSAVERKLEKLRGQKLTYVDASSLVFLAQHRIRAVWGTDQHLGIEGARVIPGA